MKYLLLLPALFLVGCLESPDLPNDASDPLQGQTPPDDPPVISVNVDCSNQGNIVNNKLDNNAKEYVLCLHNKFRSDVALGDINSATGYLPEAMNMQALSWDSTLEQVAQNYAENCVWEHNSNRTDDFKALNGNPDITYVGENIAYQAYTANPMMMSMVENSFNAMAVGEADDWDYGRINPDEDNIQNSDNCKAGEQCGHATQMFWADTRYLGCAVTHCDPSMTNEPTFTDIYLVCNYGQGGNYLHQYPYKQTDNDNSVSSDTREDGQLNCKEGLTYSDNYEDGLP